MSEESSVQFSGFVLSLVTTAAAIWAPPPGLLSITMGWPSCAPSSGPMARMRVSTAPPGGKGMTNLIGLDG